MTRAARRGARVRGFSVMLMLALMLVLGSLLAYAATLTGSLHGGAARELAVARAHEAAWAGLEWGRHRIRMGVAASCAATTSLTIPLSAGAMPVTVTCVVTGTHAEGAATVTTYQLSATACRPALAGACPGNAAAADYVERTVSGAAER